MMPEACAIARCPRCAYDISTTQADGFLQCPECGADLTDLTRIAPRPAPVWARTLVFLFSIAPTVWIGMGFLSVDGPFGLADILAVLILWPLSSIPVYYANRALERWRHPLGAGDRAFAWTVIAVGLQLLIPMLAYLGLIAIGHLAA